MKRYDTKSMRIGVDVCTINQTVELEVNFFDEVGWKGCKKITLPAEFVKSKIYDSAFAKHILDFFIKE